MYPYSVRIRLKTHAPYSRNEKIFLKFPKFRPLERPLERHVSRLNSMTYKSPKEQKRCTPFQGLPQNPGTL